MANTKTTKPAGGTPDNDPNSHQNILKRQRQRMARNLLKRRRRKSGQ